MDKEINSMKYSEMQKIAKQVGIKANMKFDRLKTALIEYYKAKEAETIKDQEICKGGPIKDQEIDKEIKEDNKKVKDEVKQRKKVKSKRKKKTQAKEKPVAETPKSPRFTPINKSFTPLQAISKTPSIETGKSIQERKLLQEKEKPVAVASKSPRFTPVNKNFTPLTAISKTPMSATGKSTQKRKLSQSPVCGEKPAKRTRNSFEKPTIPNEPSPRPMSRRSTFSVENIKKDKKPSISPGVKDLVCSMDTDKSNEEMKQNLINALDKKVQQKVQTVEKKEKLTSSTQIPRFAAFLEKKKQEQNKPITPGNKDWTKIHKKEFDKFDSIDVYLEKKRKHREDSSMSMKKARLLVEQTKEAINRLKNHKTPAKENKVVPKVSKSGHLMKSPSAKVFKPTVLTTNKMNLNFNTTTPINRDKKTPKTDARKSTGIKTPKTDSRKSTGNIQPRFTTPFKFNATLNNTIDIGRSAKKPSFDLKASLSRPMTWKTHKGKLKDMSDTYVANNSAKSVKVKSREERRTSAMNKRADQKFNSQMSRRGVVH